MAPVNHRFVHKYVHFIFGILILLPAKSLQCPRSEKSLPPPTTTAPPPPPKFKFQVSPVQSEVLQGKTAKFSCTVSNYEPRYKLCWWQKNKCVATSLTGTCELKLSKALLKHSDNYKCCVIKNSDRKIQCSSEVTLQVFKKPNQRTHSCSPTGARHVYEGDEIEYACQVGYSRPLAKLKWDAPNTTTKLYTQKGNDKNTQLLFNNVSLKASQELNGQTLKCILDWASPMSTFHVNWECSVGPLVVQPITTAPQPQTTKTTTRRNLLGGNPMEKNVTLPSISTFLPNNLTVSSTVGITTATRYGPTLSKPIILAESMNSSTPNNIIFTVVVPTALSILVFIIIGFAIVTALKRHCKRTNDANPADMFWVSQIHRLSRSFSVRSQGSSLHRSVSVLTRSWSVRSQTSVDDPPAVIFLRPKRLRKATEKTKPAVPLTTVAEFDEATLPGSRPLSTFSACPPHPPQVHQETYDLHLPPRGFARPPEYYQTDYDNDDDVSSESIRRDASETGMCPSAPPDEDSVIRLASYMEVIPNIAIVSARAKVSNL